MFAQNKKIDETKDFKVTNRKNWIQPLLQYGIYYLLAFVCLILVILSDKFLSISNLTNVMLQTSIIGVLAIGMTFVISTGNIDISVGSLIAICSAVGIGLIKLYNIPWWLGMLAMIIVGSIFGVVNGALVSYLKIPSMLVTLASQSIAAGLVLVVSGGKSWYDLPAQFGVLSTGKIAGVPYLIWIVILLYLIFNFVLGRTVYGRRVLAVGGNPELARVSGLKVNKLVLSVYILCGAVAGIAAILQTARLNAFWASMGSGMEMQVIAATVIGGTSMTGGRGTMLGTFAGVLLMGVINNALNLLGVTANWQEVARGLIIMIAIIIDAIKAHYDRES